MTADPKAAEREAAARAFLRANRWADHDATLARLIAWAATRERDAAVGALRDAFREHARCRECAAVGVRLWRQYGVFANHVKLLCTACALANQGMTAQDSPTSIGWLVPALPADGGAFWGYTSAPDDDVAWWRALPALEQGTPATEPPAVPNTCCYGFNGVHSDDCEGTPREPTTGGTK